MKKTTAQSFPRTALAAALLLELTVGAHAATIVVDNNSCTLANAITAANTDTADGGCDTGSGDDVIELPTDSTITLTEALPDILNNVTIEANGSTINRDNSAAEFSVIQVGNTANIGSPPVLILNNAIVTGGSRANNYGGGIYVSNSTLILNDSIISNNIGGGITLSRPINSEINRSIISDNLSFPGGTYYGGALSIAAGSLSVNESTISNNNSDSGLGGGGIYASDYGGILTLSINNSTITNNVTSYDGGGIIHYVSADPSSSQITINSSSIVNNQSGGNGGGINNDTADFEVNQSIIAGNTATLDGNEIISTGGTFSLNNFNLIGLNNDNGSVGITVGVTDIVPNQANLSDIIDTALADNGGPTPTHNLVESSPAIDAIMPGDCATANDQIGNLRGNDGNDDMIDGCDIGAVEFHPLIDLIFEDGFETPPN